MEIQVVFDIESTPPRPIGTYERTEEDVVIYQRPDGVYAMAPEDCVTVRSIDPIAPQT